MGSSLFLLQMRKVLGTSSFTKLLDPVPNSPKDDVLDPNVNPVFWGAPTILMYLH